MYELYYFPGNASMTPHFLLEEMGVEFELRLVDKNQNAQKSEEYLVLNPAGRIPTLVHDDLVIFESPAICIYLAEQSPELKLIPPEGAKNRPLFHQWLMYLTNTLQSELMIYFYPERHTTNPDGVSSIRQAQELRIIEIFSLLDNQLSGRDFLVGSEITACDFFLFMLSLWSAGIQQPPLSLPNIGPYLKAIAARPSVIRVCAKEGMDISNYM